MSNKDKLEKVKDDLKINLYETRFMKFMGGKNLLFTLLILIAIGVTIFIFNQVSYIFKPFIIIINTLLHQLLYQ